MKELSDECINASALMREVITMVVNGTQLEGQASQLLLEEHLRDFERQLTNIFERKYEDVTYRQLMTMAKHRRFGTRDAKMRTTASPTEIARSVAAASRDMLSRLIELQKATDVEITTVRHLRSRVPPLISDSSDSEVEEVSTVRGQARETVGASEIKQQRLSARAFLITHADGAIVYRAEREGLTRSVAPC